MSGYTICHCGKCDVKCNKHGKRAKCDECGKRRMMGTRVSGNKISHICEECCDKYIAKPIEETNELYNKTSLSRR